jgi:DNA-binding response OmpR family regulator
MPRLLLVDDDVALTDVIGDWFADHNYIVDRVHRFDDAESYLRTYAYDVIILDWLLPDGHGIDLCHQFRLRGGSTPIILLTGKRAISEKEMGLDCGADDYLTKPFDIKELAARVRALLRRASVQPGLIVEVGDLTFSPKEHAVFKAGRKTKLYRQDFALLEFFLRHQNEVFSAEVLLDRVWRSDATAGPETVRTCIRRIRQQIDTAGQPSYIETVYGVGYRFRNALEL